MEQLQRVVAGREAPPEAPDIEAVESAEGNAQRQQVERYVKSASFLDPQGRERALGELRDLLPPEP